MIADLFNALLYQPLYNALVVLISTVPLGDVGIAVVILTVAVKFLLLPLAVKATKVQLLMRGLEPKLQELKEKHKENREELARQTLSLYRTRGINPFSSFSLLLIQLPIIFALYWVFFKGGLPAINEDFLYSFVTTPLRVNIEFLGLIDVSGKSVVLSLLAGASQFFQARLMLPKVQKRSANPSLKEDLARSFQLQMKYAMPVMVAFIAYFISAAVALYWTTSNIFSIMQDLLVRRRLVAKHEQEQEKNIAPQAYGAK